jgi:hypothetical protein
MDPPLPLIRDRCRAEGHAGEHRAPPAWSTGEQDQRRVGDFERHEREAARAWLAHVEAGRIGGGS